MQQMQYPDDIFSKQNSGRIDLKDTGSSFIAIKGKCSKISNTFCFLLSKKIWVIRAGIHKLLVKIANREDPDQTASSEAV